MTRRRRLILQYFLVSASLLAITSAAVWWGRRAGRPYVPGHEVEGVTRELARSLPAGIPQVQFTDVAQQAGIDFQHFRGRRSTQLPEDMGSGAAWGDYDGDGYPDLYLVDIAAPLTATPEESAQSAGGNRLYRNRGDGTFTDVTQAAGVGFRGTGMAAAWADFDSDGHLDLVVTSYGPIVLYRNRGDGAFEEVSHKAGLGDYRGFWTGASWADYDRDGNLDLYVCGYVRYSFHPEDRSRTSRQYTSVVPSTLNPSAYPPERNLLFRNLGNGRFREVARAAGVENSTGRSLSASWFDFDGDGWQDLYVANDISDNALYLNRRNGKFRDAAHSAWVADYRGAMGLGVGDWDRDGDADIFITHWMAQQYALFSNLRRTGKAEDNPQLHFQDVADLVGVGQVSLNVIGWGTSFFDYDNDGQLDLLAVNGSTFQDEADPSRLVAMNHLLFWQKNPQEGFFELSGVSGPSLQKASVGRGAAFADYDRDGDIDVLVVNHQGRPFLLRNDGGNRNHWIKVRLKCSVSNRACLGARVEVRAAGSTQYDELGGQSSYLSQNFQEAHFGLGRATRVDSIVVTFPRGRVQELAGVPANRVVVVEEGR